MGDVIDTIAEEFTPAELILVAEGVGMAPTTRWPKRRLVRVIMARIESEGVPEPPTDINFMSQGDVLLEDFIYIAGYVNDDGNLTDRKWLSTLSMDVDEFMQLHGIGSKPPCYGFADDQDPSCKRCMLYIYCAELRLSRLPPCFGLLYSEGNPECLSCMERLFCRESKALSLTIQK